MQRERPSRRQMREKLNLIAIIRQLQEPDITAIETMGVVAEQIHTLGMPRDRLAHLSMSAQSRAESTDFGDHGWRIEAQMARFIPPEMLSIIPDVQG